jgi:Homing endonuclease associated repeat
MPAPQKHDATALVAELRTVAGIEPNGPLTRATFTAHSAIGVSTVLRRFGGWREALEAAGPDERYW